MPLNEKHPQAVFFVCAERPDGSHYPVGTCFLVGLPGTGDAWWRYFVTAAHVVIDGKAKFIRFRREDGTVVDREVGEWACHSRSDVAATPCPPEILDGVVHAFVEDWVWSDRWAERTSQPLRIGEEAYFVGLLHDVPTMADRNIPMVRSGRVGAYFQERIPMKAGDVQRVEPVAHLLDSYSRGGFSGSPCFTDHPLIREHRQEEGVALEVWSWVALLGVVIGHFNTEGDNAGIAVVTPIEAVRELLADDPLVEWRNAMDKEAIRMREEERWESAADEDRVGAEDATEFERFEDLTRKLVNTPKPDEKAKDES